MGSQGIGQVLVYCALLVALAYPLGLWMAHVYSVPRLRFAGLENGFIRLGGRPREQNWKSYATTLLIFSAVFWFVVYGFQRLQSHLFLNPDHLGAVPSHIALNT